MAKVRGSLLWIVAGLLAAFAAAVALGAWANASAKTRATMLCAQIQPGHPAQAAQELRRGQARRQLASAPNGLHFFFQGWVFNGAVCVVTLQSGVVAEAKVVEFRD